MHNHYIINNTFDFHPATSTLRDLNEPANVVVLNSPAGRCLLLLINRQGNIVTQHEVMDTVWEQSGMQVSPNTYYQNISILRKGLKKIGIGEELIVTIPRIGLTLASGTQIRKLITEKEVEIDHEPDHSIPEQDTPPLPTKVDVPVDPPDFLTEFPIPTNRLEEVTGTIRGYKRLSRRQITLASSGIFLLLILIAGFAVWFSDTTNHRYFDRYSRAALRSSCNVFLSNEIKSNADRIKALSYVNTFEESCQSYPWIYISRFPMLRRTSVIRCDAPMSQPNTCVSDYFIETNK